MGSLFRRGWTGTGLVLLLAVSGQGVYAIPTAAVDYDYEADLPGMWTYVYTIDNTGGTYDIDYFQVDDLSGTPIVLASPDQWNYVGGIGFAAWETPSWDPDPNNYDLIEVGEIRDRFKIVSNYGPAAVPFLVQGAGGSTDGMTMGPVVPEASTFVLFGLGLLVLLGYFRGRKTTAALRSSPPD